MKALLKNPLARLLIAVVFFGLIFIFLRQLNVDFSGVTVEAFKEKINSFGIWGPIMYIVFYIIRPLVLFPAAVFSATAGVIWGLKGFIYLLIAANLSSTVEFFVARYFAREVIERFLKGKIGDIDNAIEKRGFVTVLLIRLIPNLPWDVQNLGLGLTKVKFRDYFLGTFIGILPASFALVYFGASFISVITDPKHAWKIVLAVALLAGVFLMQKYLRKRQA